MSILVIVARTRTRGPLFIFSSCCTLHVVLGIRITVSSPLPLAPCSLLLLPVTPLPRFRLPVCFRLRPSALGFCSCPGGAPASPL